MSQTASQFMQDPVTVLATRGSVQWARQANVRSTIGPTRTDNSQHGRTDDSQYEFTACLPACLSACLSACLPVCLPACLQGLGWDGSSS
ncbi:MAG: hypothetical protein ACJA0P_003097 [Planctomycetota bacterium]|jgi:hypothetical protein